MVGPHLGLLVDVFVGYGLTFVGSLIGLAWGVASGLLVGYIGARLYNLIAGCREKWSFREDGRKRG